MQREICFFGHFGAANFGNDITLQTMLYHLRLRFPDAKCTCICSEPEALAASMKAVPIGRRFVKPWRLRTRWGRLLRGLFIGVPSELCRWPAVFKALKGADALIVPGTGLLQDSGGLT